MNTTGLSSPGIAPFQLISSCDPNSPRRPRIPSGMHQAVEKANPISSVRSRSGSSGHEVPGRLTTQSTWCASAARAGRLWLKTRFADPPAPSCRWLCGSRAAACCHFVPARCSRRASRGASDRVELAMSARPTSLDLSAALHPMGRSERSQNGRCCCTLA